MALVKKSKIASGLNKAPPPPASKPQHRPAKTSSRSEQASERIAAATEQLASGLAQSAAAPKELA
jgi:methyl-accepting chemotaxis protein